MIVLPSFFACLQSSLYPPFPLCSSTSNPSPLKLGPTSTPPDLSQLCIFSASCAAAVSPAGRLALTSDLKTDTVQDILEVTERLRRGWSLPSMGPGVQQKGAECPKLLAHSSVLRPGPFDTFSGTVGGGGEISTQKWVSPSMRQLFLV